MGVVRKVKGSVKFFYGMGSAIEVLQAQIFNVLLFFYYVQVLGLSGTLAGLATFLSMFIDAISDPVVGSLSDRSKSKYGRRHPFMAFAILPFLLAFYFLFAPPESVVASQNLLFAWLLILGVLVKLFVTIYAIPHLAMGGELSSDFYERSKIMVHRHLWGALVAIGLLVVGFAVFFKKTADGVDGRLLAEQYPKYMLVVVVVSFAVMFSTVFFTRKEIPSMSTADEDLPGFSLRGLFKDMVQALSNKNYRFLLFGMCFTGLGIGMLETLGLHMSTYFFEITSAQISVGMFAMVVGTIVGAAITLKLHRWFGKKNTLVGGMLVSTFLPLIPIVLRLLDLFFPNHHPLLFPAITIFGAIGSVGIAAFVITMKSMLGDVADESALQSNRRQEGIFYSARMFVGKSIHALGHLIAGVILDYYILFPKGGKDTILPGDVAPDIIFRLGLSKVVIIGVLASIGCYFYSKYTITEEVHNKTLEEMANRKLDPVVVAGNVN